MFMFEYSYTSVTEVFCSGTCGESHLFTGTNFLFECCNYQGLYWKIRARQLQ